MGKLYNIVALSEFNTVKKIQPGSIACETVSGKFEMRYSYKLRLKGQVGIPATHRTEDIYPAYYRKIDDSLRRNGTEWALVFGDFNYEYERSCYYMCRGNFISGENYVFSFGYTASGAENNIKISVEVYYGKQKTRYYYEKADETYEFDLKNAEQYSNISKKICFVKPVDFIMVKISGMDFHGIAQIFTPSLKGKDGTEYIEKFECNPEDLQNPKWIGEGFSTCLKPYFNVKINGENIFSGRKYDRLNSFAGIEFTIPDGLLKERNFVEIENSAENRYSYDFKAVQIIAMPKEFEVLGVNPWQNVGKEFGVLIYSDRTRSVHAECTDLEFLGTTFVEQGVSVLKFKPLKCGVNVKCRIMADDINREFMLKEIFEKHNDGILTGSGDFIYINQNYEDFIEYISWYLNEGIGNMVTLRSAFRWGVTSEYEQSFWKNAVKILCDLGLYYCLMTDGRELNGVNANPPVEVLASKYFLGEQTHERDGAFTYWQQKVGDSEALFYHLLSRKLERNGIYGKFSPVYNSSGEACIYYTGEGISDVKSAYENFTNNLRRTCADGATRHTGVTPLFKAFFEAGYQWVGYESLYGNHEILFGAIRGISRSQGIDNFGSHIALQWSTVPCDDYAHALRYKLSVLLAYMHGVSWINTEEGLWNIENLFADYDRFTKPCIMHRKMQANFFKYVLSHERKGKMVRRIAMIQGKYDGMDCFSTGRVYGQYGEEWKYDEPEKSWDLLKVFYPEATIGSVYYCVYKGGAKALEKEKPDLFQSLTNLYGNIRDYGSLGLFSSTPFGAIDIISADADNYEDYEMLFYSGWNTCDEQQLKKLCKFLESGKTVVMSKVHLFDSINRKEVFSGKASVIDSKYVKELLSYTKSGKLVYFDEYKYPAKIEKYSSVLEKLAKEHKSEYVQALKNISYTEYLEEDGSIVFYFVNINWWNRKSAFIEFKTKYDEKVFEISDNDLHAVKIKDEKINMRRACLRL